MSAVFDVAMVQFDLSTVDSNGDKIAEAEALAAEALRMANEAKRAAERLAEVKATLAMFSKKLDKVERYVEVPSVEKRAIDEATPFETDKALALPGASTVVSTSPSQPKPETPLRKKADAPVNVTAEAPDLTNEAVLVVKTFVRESAPEEKKVAAIEEFVKEDSLAVEEHQAKKPVEKEEPCDEVLINDAAVPAARTSKKVTIKETPVPMDRERASAPQASIQKEVEKEFFAIPFSRRK